LKKGTARVRHRALDAGRSLLDRRHSAAPGEIEALRKTAAELKSALLAEMAIGRGLERARSSIAHGSAGHTEVTYSPAWESATADVTVVIPLFNQGHFLAEAIASVCASDHPSIELVVVDDHSTDGSAGVAAELLAASPWLPSALVA